MSLLADSIVEAAATYRAIPKIAAEYRYLADKIKGAQRFVISDDVRSAIRNLLSSRPSTLVEAARFAKLPFDRCWLEWVPPGLANLHPGQVPVRRCGGRSAFRVHTEVNGHARIVDQLAEIGSTHSILDDVQDEMGHLFATLILMNSKNCVQVAPAEPEAKLNKARRKRGKPELLPYSTVRIELTKRQERAVESGLITREEARRHLVRGHFKVRASGVFWWGEFWRGNALKGVVERRGHIVEAGGRDLHGNSSGG